MKVKGLIHGIYEIYWTTGGSSLASVGYDRQGYNWVCPCNWTSGETLDWSSVKAVKILIVNDYSKKTKSIKTSFQKIPFISEHFKIEEED